MSISNINNENWNFILGHEDTKVPKARKKSLHYLECLSTIISNIDMQKWDKETLKCLKDLVLKLELSHSHLGKEGYVNNPNLKDFLSFGMIDKNYFYIVSEDNKHHYINHLNHIVLRSEVTELDFSMEKEKIEQISEDAYKWLFEKCVCTEDKRIEFNYFIPFKEVTISADGYRIGKLNNYFYDIQYLHILYAAFKILNKEFEVFEFDTCIVFKTKDNLQHGFLSQIKI